MSKLRNSAFKSLAVLLGTVFCIAMFVSLTSCAGESSYSKANKEQLITEALWEFYGLQGDARFAPNFIYRGTFNGFVALTPTADPRFMFPEIIPVAHEIIANVLFYYCIRLLPNQFLWKNGQILKIAQAYEDGILSKFANLSQN